jgi:hypothetical protein
MQATLLAEHFFFPTITFSMSSTVSSTVALVERSDAGAAETSRLHAADIRNTLDLMARKFAARMKCCSEGVL